MLCEDSLPQDKSMNLPKPQPVTKKGIPLPKQISTFDGNHLVSLTRVINEDELVQSQTSSLATDRSDLSGDQIGNGIGAGRAQV